MPVGSRIIRQWPMRQKSMSSFERIADRAARATPPALGRRVRGLSDRAIAWLFIAPTIILLLAINIFPLIWTIYLSFTNYASNRPNRPVINVGLKWYRTFSVRRTSGPHAGDRPFRVLDHPVPDADRLRARLSHRPQVPRPCLLDDHHSHSDDAVAGGGRQFLEVPLSAADRAVQLHRLVLHRHSDHPPSRCWAR